MATDNGISSNGLMSHPLAEPLHSLPGSRKGSGEDAVTTSDNRGSPCRPSIIPVACQSSSPNGDSHNYENTTIEFTDDGKIALVPSCDDLRGSGASDIPHKSAESSPVKQSSNSATPAASPGSPTSSTLLELSSRLHDPEGFAMTTLESPKREEGRVAVDVVDCASRPIEERPTESSVKSSLSNGFLHHADAAAVLEVQSAAVSETPCRNSIFEPLQNGKLPEQLPCAGSPTHSSDAKPSESSNTKPVTTPPESPRENGKPCCNGREEVRMLVASQAVVGSSPTAQGSVVSANAVSGIAGKKHCVPNGDVGSRCVRDSVGVGGDKTVLSTPPALPEGRRRSASDGAVQENGWARRGRSSHSECNGLDRRTIVLSSSSGSSSGSTEGPDSPLPGEVLGSGVRWTGGGRSVSEVKELAYARLQAELSRAQQELRLRDEEVARLSQIRDQVGAELEELTASLFEEANNMVREANMKQAAAEKRLQEATLKVEVLQAEVSALKALVLTSTPSRPNAHLHPQLSRHRHRRSPSNYELATCRPPSPPSQQVSQQQQQQSQSGQPGSDGASPDLSEVDPVCHREFLRWQEKPSITDREDMFVSRLYREDVLPCLHFPNCQLAAQVLRAIEENSITIEAVNAANPFPRRCSLLEASRVCQYRMRLGDSGSAWYHISQLCRNRITSVCDLFCYLRYIQQGLVRSSSQEMYWEVMRRRRSIALARLGLPPC
uniref:Putative rab-3a-interacting protein n=1 Tax=Rhipicephalus pulchellus TaxID=72859 RepID=L7LUT2_RHIPC